uniref:Uncharacterized protein n=1 Tax=Avena sativa TaxID=4498 RepID=A0ACD5VDI0_AVESA
MGTRPSLPRPVRLACVYYKYTDRLGCSIVHLPPHLVHHHGLQSEQFFFQFEQAPEQKLLVDSKTQRVVYAEAGKDVVDFLFNLLMLPFATVVELLTGGDSMVGCVANLYRSVEKLDDAYVCHDDAKSAKDALLRPAGNGKLLMLPDHASSSSGNGRSSRSGFVEGIVTYTVMDNLTVTPMSTISAITMLNTFGIRNTRSLSEKTVRLGYNEGVQILKASLESKTVLTDVFLGTTTSRRS